MEYYNDELIDGLKKEKYHIKISSYEQLCDIFKIARNYGLANYNSTVDEENCLAYPYICYDNGGFHGWSRNTGYKVYEFEEWYELVTNESPEIEQSDFDIDFLL